MSVLCLVLGTRVLISPLPGDRGTTNPGGRQGGDRGNLFDHLPLRPWRCLGNLLLLLSLVLGSRQSHLLARSARGWHGNKERRGATFCRAEFSRWGLVDGVTPAGPDEAI